MTDARSRILQRVRSALRDVPKSEASAGMALTRDYRTASDQPQAELVELFARGVAEYKATVRQVAAAELPDGHRRRIARRAGCATWPPLPTCRASGCLMGLSYGSTMGLATRSSTPPTACST